MKNILCGLLLVLFGCQQEQKVGLLASATTPPAYELCTSGTLPEGITVQVQLDTSKQSYIRLKALVRNASATALKLNLFETSLLSHDLRRHTALAITPETETLAAGAEQEYQWIFRPVNDLYLYQRSGLTGPWAQEYRLPLNFIEGVHDTLTFCFPEEAYQQYSKKIAARKPVLYMPSSTALSPETIAQQEQYWKEINSNLKDAQAASAYFSEQEFFNAGVNLRHALYHQGDSLYLQLQLINHASYILTVQPDALVASVSGNTYPPSVKQHPEHAKEEPYLVRKGDRLSLTLAYPVPTADSLQISLNGIVVSGLEKPLFSNAVTYIRQ